MEDTISKQVRQQVQEGVRDGVKRVLEIHQQEESTKAVEQLLIQDQNELAQQKRNAISDADERMARQLHNEEEEKQNKRMSRAKAFELEKRFKQESLQEREKQIQQDADLVHQMVRDEETKAGIAKNKATIKQQRQEMDDFRIAQSLKNNEFDGRLDIHEERIRGHDQEFQKIWTEYKWMKDNVVQNREAIISNRRGIADNRRDFRTSARNFRSQLGQLEQQLGSFNFRLTRTEQATAENGRRIAYNEGQIKANSAGIGENGQELVRLSSRVRTNENKLVEVCARVTSLEAWRRQMETASRVTVDCIDGSSLVDRLHDDNSRETVALWDVRCGDHLLTQGVPDAVLAVVPNQSPSECLQFDLENGESLVVTGNHPLLDAEGRTVAANDVKYGASLFPGVRVLRITQTFATVVAVVTRSGRVTVGKVTLQSNTDKGVKSVPDRRFQD